MDSLVWARVCAAFLVDASLAVLCGLLLAERWLAGTIETQHERSIHSPPSIWRGMKTVAALLCIGLCWQLLLLAMTFGGESGLRAAVSILPDVSGTHAGSMLVMTCLAAGVLFALTWLPRGQVRSGLRGLLAVCLVGLHGAVGHAAVDGVFSVAEALQWIHLLAMAAWSGGVLVSGLLVVPRMREAADVRRYLKRLSALSTWCVLLVLLSGVVKGYRVTGGFALLRSSDWGHILVLKTVAVTLTVCLGARNRWLLGSSSQTDEALMQSTGWTLRAEALCMAGVLLLSAWLANSPLPME